MIITEEMSRRENSVEVRSTRLKWRMFSKSKKKEFTTQRSLSRFFRSLQIGAAWKFCFCWFLIIFRCLFSKIQKSHCQTTLSTNARSIVPFTFYLFVLFALTQTDPDTAKCYHFPIFCFYTRFAPFPRSSQSLPLPGTQSIPPIPPQPPAAIQSQNTKSQAKIPVEFKIETLNTRAHLQDFLGNWSSLSILLNFIASSLHESYRVRAKVR